MKGNPLKLVLVGLISLLLFNCSSDDEGTNLDLNLLHGQWYRVGLCAEQNSVLLNADGTYESFSSGAIDCDDPEPDTYKFTGTYTIRGNFYIGTELTRELVIDGTSITEFDFPNPNIKNEIIELTENTLVIKVYENREDNLIYIYGEFEYQH